MSFDITMSPELARALVAYDDLLFRTWQTRRHLVDAYAPLSDLNLVISAKRVRKMSLDLDEMLMTGELSHRISEAVARQHPVLLNPVEGELLRQMAAVGIPLLFGGIEEGHPRYANLSTQYNAFLDAARQALAGCGEE